MSSTDLWDLNHPDARALAAVTEASARAAASWLGHGEATDLSRAARRTMKRALDESPFYAEIVIGDDPGNANHRSPLAVGKNTGSTGGTVVHDLALDPTEGASFLVQGQTNAMSVAVLAPRSTLLRPGPAFVHGETCHFVRGSRVD